MHQNTNGFTIATLGAILFFITVIILHGLRPGEQPQAPTAYDSDIIVSGHSARMVTRTASTASAERASVMALDVNSPYSAHINRPRE